MSNRFSSHLGPRETTGKRPLHVKLARTPINPSTYQQRQTAWQLGGISALVELMASTGETNCRCPSCRGSDPTCTLCRGYGRLWRTEGGRLIGFKEKYPRAT